MRAIVEFSAKAMAVLGGLVLTALVVLICISITGRGLNTLGHSDLLTNSWPGLATWLIGTGVKPVTGDFELVQAGMAFTVFAFLPLCQFRSGHATVDIFTNRLPPRLNQWLTTFWELMLSLVILIIAWRLFAGLLVKFGNGQTSILLEFPMWWSYGASFVAACVAGLISIYCAIGRFLDTATGSAWMPAPESKQA